MKKFVAVLAVLAFAANAFAVADVMEFKKGVKFNHKAHQEKLKDCTKCHEGKPEGGKMGMNKDTAHNKLCKDCHTKMKAPAGCKDCHK